MGFLHIALTSRPARISFNCLPYVFSLKGLSDIALVADTILAQVASALSDPYLSFAAALNGLAGPLHGLANQVLKISILSFSEADMHKSLL